MYYTNIKEDKVTERIMQFLRKHPYDIGAYKDGIDYCEYRIRDGDDLYGNLHEIRNLLQDAVMLNPDTPLITRMDRLNRRSLIISAQVDIDAYMLALEYDRDPVKKFYKPRRRTLRTRMVENVQDLMDDRLDILCISMPPGTGKTTCGIFILSWVIGKYPHNPSLVSAHSGFMTKSIYDGVSEVISDSDYNWKEIFPDYGTVITNSKEETIDIGKKHRFSSLTCRAIDASLTGATRCEKLLYADDLVSGIEEALNMERMEKLHLKYVNDLKSRKKLHCKELHVQTRWSLRDIVGRLEEEYGNDPRFRAVIIPAVDENGRSNFLYDYDVGFDEQYFKDMELNMDEASYQALFMGRPIEREGVLYHKNEMRRYFKLPDGDPDAVIAICDTKDKGADYAFLPVAYQYGTDYYIEDCICDNGKPEAVEARIMRMLVDRKVQVARFESNSAGGRVAKDINEAVQKNGGITHITTKYTTTNKETKIIVNSPWVKQHCLFKDDSMITRGTDYDKMMRMLFAYTMNGKSAHDDVPDGLAMLSEFAQSMTYNKVEFFQRPF